MEEAVNDIEEVFNTQSDDVRYGLSDEKIKEIIEAARAQDSDTVFAAMSELSTADTADLISKVNDDDR